MKRPDGVTLISVYYWFLAVLSAFMICGSVFWVIGGDRGLFGLILGLLFWPFFMLASAIANVAVGWGLWNLKSWARMAAIVLAILQLLVFPVGTIIGALIIWYLWQDPDALGAFNISRS